MAVTSNRTALPEYSHSHSEEVPPPLYERSQSISNLAISAAGGSARGSGNNVVSTSSPTPPSPTASSVSSPSMSESGTNNLEEVSSYLISQLKKKPKKEQQLKVLHANVNVFCSRCSQLQSSLFLQEAQEIQSQIENLELTLDTAEVEGTAKRRLLNLEIEELQTKLAETKKEIAKVEEDLEEVRKWTGSAQVDIDLSPSNPHRIFF